MGASIESLRQDFLRILDEIEKIQEQTQNFCEVSETSESLRESSCIKIKGKPILPPVMTQEKRLKCQEFRDQAVQVEAKLAEKRKEKFSEISQAMEENQTHQKVSSILSKNLGQNFHCSLFFFRRLKEKEGFHIL